MKVLIVDDNQGTINSLEAILVASGYYPITASDGNQALEEIKQSIEKSEPIELIVTDLIMPGMNGLELIHAAKKLLPDLPAVLITAYGISDIRKEAINLDHCEYLEKPFDPSGLTRAINDLLDNERPSRLSLESLSESRNIDP